MPRQCLGDWKTSRSFFVKRAILCSSLWTLFTARLTWLEAESRCEERQGPDFLTNKQHFPWELTTWQDPPSVQRHQENKTTCENIKTCTLLTENVLGLHACRQAWHFLKKIMLLSLKPLWMLIWCRKREHLIFLFNVLVLKIKYGILTNCLEKNSLPLSELPCTGYHPYPWGTLIKAAQYPPFLDRACVKVPTPETTASFSLSLFSASFFADSWKPMVTKTCHTAF